MVLFDDEDIDLAMTDVVGGITMWKSWKEPGKRVDLMLNTHGLKLKGYAGKPLWKIWLPVLMIVIARKKRVGDIPDPALLEL